MHPDWLIPDWPAPPGVHAVCSTRAGGHSSGPYASLNLGDHVGDAPSAVRANRAILIQAMGARAVFLNQVHGLDVVRLDADSRDGIEADAVLSATPGLACTVMVADCLPVLFCDAQGLQVGAAHAGWRGLAGRDGEGILERTCQSLCRSGDATLAPSDLIAWLGPCIGARAFEVGDEVRDCFVASDARAASLFRPCGAGKWLADLAGLARLRLTALGVTRIHGNDGSDDWCTVSQPQRFFSYRRDRVCGRMAASVWRET